MPFTRVDLAAYDEFISEMDPEELPPDFVENRPSGDWEYDAASDRFEPEKLGAVSRAMLEILRGAGATGFRVRYDGGYDEGFAQPDVLLFGEQARTVGEIARELATPELIARILKAADPNHTARMAGVGVGDQMQGALDELAGELAVTLLGSGFGTGEGELYGAFVADLNSGDLVDDPHAAKPEQVG
jgi:hypothetical protein